MFNPLTHITPGQAIYVAGFMVMVGLYWVGCHIAESKRDE